MGFFGTARESYAGNFSASGRPVQAKGGRFPETPIRRAEGGNAGIMRGIAR